MIACLRRCRLCLVQVSSRTLVPSRLRQPQKPTKIQNLRVLVLCFYIECASVRHRCVSVLIMFASTSFSWCWSYKASRHNEDVKQFRGTWPSLVPTVTLFLEFDEQESMRALNVTNYSEIFVMARCGFWLISVRINLRHVLIRQISQSLPREASADRIHVQGIIC